MFGKCVVQSRVALLEDPIKHCFRLDSFFLSHALFRRLRDMGAKITGTVPEKRTSQGPIEYPSLFKKKIREEYEYFTDKHTNICQRLHEKPVKILSNNVTVTPIKKWNGRWRALKEINGRSTVYDQRLQPENGGVDLLDRHLAFFSTSNAFQKLVLVHNLKCLNICVVAAWKNRGELGNKYSQLEFLRTVVRTLFVESPQKQYAIGPNWSPCGNQKKSAIIISILQQLLKDGAKYARKKLPKKMSE